MDTKPFNRNFEWVPGSYKRNALVSFGDRFYRLALDSLISQSLPSEIAGGFWTQIGIGAPQRAILFGPGVPAAGIGEVGDLFISQDPPNTLYSKVNPTTWQAEGDLQGPAGLPGPVNPITYFYVTI